MVDQKSDLLIIGGGALGTFHAYHAIQQGLSVVLLERSAAPRGATVRNFGQIVPSGMDSTWQRYGRESLRIYKSIQSEFDISVRNLGSIYIASNEEELCLLEELHAINQGDEYPSKLLSVDACVQRYPSLRREYCAGGLYFPDEVSVNPRVMIHRVHRFLSENKNHQSHFNCCVRELDQGTNGCVRATCGDGSQYFADRAIVCSGSEFQILYPELFRTSDIKAVKIQMLRLKPQSRVQLPGNILTGLSIRRYESFAQCPSWQSVKANEPSDSFWKRWGVHILFKQESDGGIIIGDSHEYASAREVDGLGFDLCTEVNEYFIHEGQRIMDLPSWQIEAAWYGIYCQTADPSGVFTHKIGDNIHIVTGIGGKGMTASPGFALHNMREIYGN